MSGPKPAPLTSYSAHELKGMTLAPLKWVVPDLIGLGLWLLAAPPKTGKSWWVLSLLLAVATGGVAFGGIPVASAPVLYLALEDNKRRLRSRLSYMDLGEGEDVWPETFYFVNEAPTVEGGLVKTLSDWLDDHPGVRVVAIDTLARVRGARDRGDDLYTSDSRLMAHLQHLALERDICILVVHHTRKMGSDDPFDGISGSYGITGPVDGMLVLQRVRGDADATLHITGRDVEERNLALRFNADDGTWKILGDARLFALSEERRSIIETLTSEPGLTPKSVATAAGLKHGSVKHLLIRMRDESLLRSDDKGRYYLVHPVHSGVETPSSTGQSTVNDTVHPPFIRSPESSPARPPGERVNGNEATPFTADSASQAKEIPQGEQSERHIEANDDLEGRATTIVGRLRQLSTDDLRQRLDVLLSDDGIPTWWRTKAHTEPLIVAGALELIVEDRKSGTITGRAPTYMAAVTIAADEPS